MLTKDDFNYLLDKQNQLDENIKNTKGISEEEWDSEEMEVKHVIALRVEVSEFVNECKDSWKYWTTKSPVPDRILDEAIDVLHFVLLIFNKSQLFSDGLLQAVMETNAKVYRSVKTVEIIRGIQTTNKTSEVLSGVFTILDRYGFTRQDVLDQYHTKNRENFRRLRNGY